ncbi:MAG: glutamine--fructose-6-phosphate transaminase (isomerizing) [Candidatus Aenigmarchaeota archaeon]|nr:glutamine--fructose-6-phosphate transaminase (isomerizing) [Candidatus Aenigmarchaeota archaeon]
MCGIVGMVFKNPFSARDALTSLKRLEYRGYDSFGIADSNGRIQKFVGEIDETKAGDRLVNTTITHTRWATHGNVTEANAHPHTDCTGSIAIVHNGIISNFSEIREEMKAEGHRFASETDSELIAHFFEGKNIADSIPPFFAKFKGEYAVLLIKKGEDAIYAFKRGSPLVLGIAQDGYVLASDIYAFSDRTGNAVFFNEDEFAVVGKNGYEFYKVNGKLEPSEKQVTAFKWMAEETKKDYEHYMMKEIKEIPEASRRLLDSLEAEQRESVESIVSLVRNAKRIVFVASGSSYHASLLGIQFLRRAGVEAHAIVASEFKNFTLIDENTLVVAVSQSGETMDVIEALHGIKARGVKIASLVNVPYSTVQRMSHSHINICAGQEVAVAATKTFVNQVLAMAYIASLLGYAMDMRSVTGVFNSVFAQEARIKDVAKTLATARDIYVLGRGFSYPVAREIALKLKEITYIHAEGMMAGELKHGTLSLIEQGTPVICLAPKGDNDIMSTAHEVAGRGANVIMFSDEARGGIKIDSTGKVSFSVMAAMAGQLLTYYIAREKGLPIDKPRNLAKSVTVK